MLLNMLLKQFLLVFVIYFGFCASCKVDEKEGHILTCTLKQLKDAGTHPEWNNLTLVNAENVQQITLENDYFKNVPNLDSLTINGVANKIEEFAFRGLNKLETLTLDHNEIRELPNIDNILTLKQFFVKNSKITKIPKNYFTKTEKLHFINIANNKITEIGDCAFCGLDKTFLILNNNTLKTFEPVRVLGTTSFISGLNLDENQLTTIQRFGKMPNFVGVNYVNNSITKIEANSFRQAPKFMLFDVSFNEVDVIDPNIFPEIIRSDEPFFLILHNNKIQCLSPEVRNKFRNLRRITLNDNPWKCECLRDVTRWAVSMKAFAGCDYPETCIISCDDEKRETMHLKYY